MSNFLIYFMFFFQSKVLIANEALKLDVLSVLVEDTLVVLEPEVNV